MRCGLLAILLKNTTFVLYIPIVVNYNMGKNTHLRSTTLFYFFYMFIVKTSEVWLLETLLKNITFILSFYMFYKKITSEVLPKVTYSKGTTFILFL